jgi:hypothetical protein
MSTPQLCTSVPRIELAGKPTIRRYEWSWLGCDGDSRSGFEGASAIRTAPMITRTATPISSPRADDVAMHGYQFLTRFRGRTTHGRDPSQLGPQAVSPTGSGMGSQKQCECLSSTSTALPSQRPSGSYLAAVIVLGERSPPPSKYSSISSRVLPFVSGKKNAAVTK